MFRCTQVCEARCDSLKYTEGAGGSSHRAVFHYLSSVLVNW